MSSPITPILSADGTVNKVAEGRILVHDEEARKAGFSPEQPYFALGTRLIEVGKENFRTSRMKYEQMPSAEEALTGLIETVRAENRRDFDVTAEQVVALEDGRLFLKEQGEPLLFTPSSFKQFVTRLALQREVANPAAYLASIEPARRARYLNDELSREPEATFKLRARQPNGHVEVYGVTSQKYAAVDADAIASAILHNVDSSAKAEVLYRGTRSRVDLLYHSDLDAGDVGVGEFYKASQRFTSDDDGTEGVRGSVSLFRALCINLTTASSTQDILRRRHSGEVENILDALRRTVGSGLGVLKFFIEAFQARTRDDARVLAAKAKGKPFPVVADPSPIFRHIFTKGRKLWEVSGATTEDVVEKLTAAWQVEHDAPEAWSVTGLSNAISRAAHEAAWSSPEVGEELEARAGALVTVPLHKVPWGWRAKAEEGEEQ